MYVTSCEAGGVWRRRVRARQRREEIGLHHYAVSAILSGGGRVVGRRTQRMKAGGARRGRGECLLSRRAVAPPGPVHASGGRHRLHVRRAEKTAPRGAADRRSRVRTLSLVVHSSTRSRAVSACAITRPRTTRDVVEIYIYVQCVQNYHSAAMSAHTYHMRTSDLLSS